MDLGVILNFPSYSEDHLACSVPLSISPVKQAWFENHVFLSGYDLYPAATNGPDVLNKLLVYVKLKAGTIIIWTAFACVSSEEIHLGRARVYSCMRRHCLSLNFAQWHCKIARTL
jgi:hypothetical protein